MALEAVGSNPTIHPIFTKTACVRYSGFDYRMRAIHYTGVSPSGKATDFDSVIALVRIQPSQPPDRSLEPNGAPGSCFI